MTFLEHATKQHVLDEKFVRAIGSIEDEEYRFPLDRAPYTHQTNSWKTLLNDKKTIVVTSGTGSGKTECFMIPVIQDLYRQKSTVVNEGVQAIFIYPLNALMKTSNEEYMPGVLHFHQRSPMPYTMVTPLRTYKETRHYKLIPSSCLEDK